MEQSVDRRQFLRRAGVLSAAAGALSSCSSGAAGSSSLLLDASSSSFGVTSSGGHYVVSTGGGLIFKINQATGGISSLNYNGTELQPAGTHESHVESGLASPTVAVRQSGNRIIVTASTDKWYGSGILHHYYVAVKGQNIIYMATYAAGGGELRWIQYLNRGILPHFNVPSDTKGGTIIESKDIFRVSGQSRSKYYSNRQARNLTVRGVTGAAIGVFMAYGNRESSAGGPFFRDIEQQGTSASIELYNYLWSGHNQTENQRLGVLYGPYALMVGGTAVPAAPDMSFMTTLGLAGAVPGTRRGWVAGKVSGASNPTVGWASPTAQYWTTPHASGDFASPLMTPGTYTQTLYQRELAVATRTVAVTAGKKTAGQNLRSAWFTPASPVFRIGIWDGTPSGFKNADKVTYMHPSDARMAPWGPVTYTVGSSSDADFPAYQWKAINNPSTIRFTLAAGQVAARTIRIGITAAYGGARPQVTVNDWTSPIPASFAQPDSRSLTIGTYRGNNHVFTFDVPASALRTGSNKMTITVVSGSAGLGGYLSPGFSYDCVEMY